MYYHTMARPAQRVALYCYFAILTVSPYAKGDKYWNYIITFSPITSFHIKEISCPYDISVSAATRVLKNKFSSFQKNLQSEPEKI